MKDAMAVVMLVLDVLDVEDLVLGTVQDVVHVQDLVTDAMAVQVLVMDVMVVRVVQVLVQADVQEGVLEDAPQVVQVVLETVLVHA